MIHTCLCIKERQVLVCFSIDTRVFKKVTEGWQHLKSARTLLKFGHYPF